ncbi:hypothetical protein LSPCS325_00830 [Lysinibacillus sp. CTST325]
MKRCKKCKKLTCSCNKSNPKIPTPVFSSPTSSLPKAQLNELKFCIDEANQLLQSLGSESDVNNTRQLQLHFLKLQGVNVKIKINCKFIERTKDEDTIKNRVIETIEEKAGLLSIAGRDFIQLNTNCGPIFILYTRLISLSHINNSQEEEPYDLEMLKNKALVLNFGEFVSKRPSLINLFFGIPLYQQLQNYIRETVQVKTDQLMKTGTLLSATENNIHIKNQKGNHHVNINDITFLQILKNKWIKC